MVAEFEKARVRDFMRDHERPRRSPLSEKLKICPTLACIAGNISGRKLSKWTLSDEHYQARSKEIRLCLHGLIGHGAHLAACGSEEQIPALRDLICHLAAFWPEDPDADPMEAEKQYGALFDKAVSDARSYGSAPELSESRKENILIGLEDYLIDMAGQFQKIDQEALDSGLAACESVAAGLRQAWSGVQQDQAPAQPSGPVLGGGMCCG